VFCCDAMNIAVLQSYNMLGAFSSYIWLGGERKQAIWHQCINRLSNVSLFSCPTFLLRALIYLRTKGKRWTALYPICGQKGDDGLAFRTLPILRHRQAQQKMVRKTCAVDRKRFRKDAEGRTCVF
jgi:hypothetical protein